MQILIGSSVFVLGAIIGSFLNVLVLRRGTGFGLFRGSFCFSCGDRLHARNLIPIVSFIIQRGKCQQCESSISAQYPLVELVTGAAFLAVAHQTGLLAAVGVMDVLYSLPYALYIAALASLLIAITVYDIRHKIIPNAWVYLFDFLAFLGLLGLTTPEASIASGFWMPFLAGVSLFAFFASFWIFSRGRWMGLGDAKLALGIGWLLGFSSGVAAIIISFWIGALAGVALIASRNLFAYARGVTLKSELPFAPFLIAGLAIVWFFEVTFADLQALFIF